MVFGRPAQVVGPFLAQNQGVPRQTLKDVGRPVEAVEERRFVPKRVREPPQIVGPVVPILGLVEDFFIGWQFDT